MDWDEFGYNANAFGKWLMTVIGIITTYWFSFWWITKPIFLSMFTDALDSKVANDDEMAVTVICWMIIFLAHCGAFSYVIGTAIRGRKRIGKFVREVWDATSSGTD